MRGETDESYGTDFLTKTVSYSKSFFTEGYPNKKKNNTSKMHTKQYFTFEIVIITDLSFFLHTHTHTHITDYSGQISI